MKTVIQRHSNFLIKMSKPDHKKEVMDLLKEGAIIIEVTLEVPNSRYQPPSAKLISVMQVNLV